METKTIRIRLTTFDRLAKKGAFGQSVDEVITTLLNTLDTKDTKNTKDTKDTKKHKPIKK